MFYKMSISEGHTSTTYDSAHSPDQNIVLEKGFYAAVDIALRLVENGVALVGPKCSLWLQFLSKGTHKRGPTNVEGAWDKRLCVFEANLINENTCVIMALLHYRKVHFGIEQPSGSFYFSYPTMVDLIGLLGLVSTTTWMINFGHWMPKPSRIVGTSFVLGLRSTWSKQRATRMASQIKEKLKTMVTKFPKQMANRCYLKRMGSAKKPVKYVGKWTVAGDNLKDSGAYTMRFCRRSLKEWKAAGPAAIPEFASFSDILGLLTFPMHLQRHVNDRLRPYNNYKGATRMQPFHKRTYPERPYNGFMRQTLALCDALTDNANFDGDPDPFATQEWDYRAFKNGLQAFQKPFKDLQKAFQGYLRGLQAQLKAFQRPQFKQPL